MEKYFGNAYRGDEGVSHSGPERYLNIWIGSVAFSALTWFNPYMWQLSNQFNNKEAYLWVKLGPKTDVTDAFSSKLQKPPPSLQICSEGLALLLHLVNVMKFPAFVIVGGSKQHISNKTSKEELQVRSATLDTWLPEQVSFIQFNGKQSCHQTMIELGLKILFERSMKKRDGYPKMGSQSHRRRN